MMTHRSTLRKTLSVTTALAAMTVGGLISGPEASAVAAVNRTVDDTVYRGANRFAYTGTWSYCKGCRADALNRSFHYSNRKGATVKITFTGVRATVYGLRQPAGGIANVVLDGRSRGAVNLAAASSGIAAVYTTPTLKRATHTLTLTVTARSTGRGHTVGIDRIVVKDAAAVVPPARPPAPRPPAPQASAQPPKPVAGNGMASLTFDDGQLVQYQYAWPALKSAGYLGTFYVVSDAMNWGPPSMSASQVSQLAAAGNEIGNHTRDHADLTDLTSAQIQAEFADSVKALTATGASVTTCAYPYGAVNATVKSIAAKYFKACRGTDGGTNGSGADAYDLRVYYVQASTTAAQVRAAADAAKSSGSWIIFVYHGVGTAATGDNVTAAQFQGHVAAVKASGITVRTVAQAMAAR
jgi:peptidoglycan/xylan/chitin deacetylase (PgdA/CDA1 family)